MFAQRKLGTALMESVLVQNSKSGLEELGATAVEPRSRVCPHPVPCQLQVFLLRVAKTALHPSALYATSNISKSSVTPVENNIWTMRDSRCHTSPTTQTTALSTPL